MPKPSRLNEILASAAAVFRDKGYDGASLDDVAKHAGVWKGSLYHYFESKEEILLAIVETPAELFLADVNATAGLDLPASERLRTVIRRHLEVYEKHFHEAAVYLHEIAGRGRSDRFAQMDHEYLAALQSIVQDGIESGEFSADLDPRLTTLAIIGALNWMARWFDPSGPRPIADVGERFATIFLNGCLVRSSTITRGVSAPGFSLEPPVASAEIDRLASGSSPSIP